MLNRRKPHNQAAGDEQEALLDASADSNWSLHVEQSIPPRLDQDTGLIDLSNASQPIISPYLQTPVSLSNQRRAHEKSPTTSNHTRLGSDVLVNNNIYLGTTNQFIPTSFNSSTISSYNQANSGENYALEPTSGNRHFRAIDISTFRHNQPQSSSNSDFIYYTVQPGDTLQNLSVKYSCPVASIKRLNNLWSDQEFFGLTRLKLPTGKLRLLADIIGEESHPDGHQGSPALKPLISDTDHNLPVHSNHQQRDDSFKSDTQPCDAVSLNSVRNLANSIGDSIFKDFDLNIEKARAAARSYDDNAKAIKQSLAKSGNIVGDDDDENDPNKIAQREAETLLNDMSDYGLSFSGLILFIFIVCLICPLAYVIYLEETHHDPFNKGG